MKIGFGVLTGECLPAEGLSQTEVLRDTITQARLCEEVGLDAVWISEHHFLANGYVGSVLPFAAAVAQATETITVGISVALAPLYDPVRLAEDAAFVDQLSGGRTALGIAIGYRDVEYEGFGSTRKQRVGRTEELCALLRQAWGEGPLDFAGRYFQRSGMEVFPKPRRPEGVPLLMGGHTPAAIDRCARLAEGFIMDGGTDSENFATEGHNTPLPARVQAALDAYKQALRRHDKPASAPRFYLTVGGFLADEGADRAWELVQDAYMYTRRTYGEWYGLDASTYEQWYPERMDARDHARRRGEILLGAPSDLIPQFERLEEIAGPNLHVMFRAKYPGVPDGPTRRAIELLGEIRDHFH